MGMGDSRSLRESKEYIIAVTQYNMDSRKTPSESLILNPITHTGISKYPITHTKVRSHVFQ